MALEMQRAYPLTEKFEKLKFFVNMSVDMSSNSSTASTPQSPAPSSPFPTTTEPFQIRAIVDGDEEPVLQHLRRFFFRDEPLNVNVELLPAEKPDATCMELEQYSLKSIKDGLSLMAVSESGQVVGVSLNGLDRRDSNEDEENEACTNPKFDKILNLLGTVDKQAQVFEQFKDVDSYINVKILSVDSNWRGRGIAKQLMDRTRDLARSKDVGLMRVDCTSEFSARAVARLGFECIYTLKYEDYLVDGVRVFNPEAPHTSVRVYIQKIQPVEQTVPEKARL